MVSTGSTGRVTELVSTGSTGRVIELVEITLDRFERF